jgi:hypothetical protein
VKSLVDLDECGSVDDVDPVDAVVELDPTELRIGKGAESFGAHTGDVDHPRRVVPRALDRVGRVGGKDLLDVLPLPPLGDRPDQPEDRRFVPASRNIVRTRTPVVCSADPVFVAITPRVRAATSVATGPILSVTAGSFPADRRHDIRRDRGVTRASCPYRRQR